MTKAEFVEFIHSFGKEPGQFTKDEIFEIGKVHKLELDNRDKSWEFVRVSVGWEGSPDSLRMFVSERLKKLNEQTKEPRNKEFEKLYIEKTKVRDSYNAYRRGLRDEARVEDLKENIILAAEKFKNLPSIKFDGNVNPSYEKREAILLLSDLHIGVECDNVYNKYNTEIAKQRLASLVKQTIQECRRNNVQKLHILNLGDMIQGIIHTNARLEAQLDVSEQIMLAGELVAQTVNELQKAAPEITYSSVFDNHSRAMADKNEAIEKEQFSRLIDWFIRERLKATEIGFFKNEIDGGVGSLTLRNGKKVVFAHGHQDSINSSWQNFIGMTREWIDYIILAHYHNAKEKTYNGSVVFVNGSIVGTEQYAFGRRLFSKPSQKLLIFNTTNSTYSDINISLE